MIKAVYRNAGCINKITFYNIKCIILPISLFRLFWFKVFQGWNWDYNSNQ